MSAMARIYVKYVKSWDDNTKNDFLGEVYFDKCKKGIATESDKESILFEIDDDIKSTFYADEIRIRHSVSDKLKDDIDVFLVNKIKSEKER